MAFEPVSVLGNIVENVYRWHDAMLGRLLQLAGDDCAVLLLSDHGFHSDQLLPDYIPAEAAGPAVEHREFGIVCLRGPGVRRGERVYGGSVLDIAPTVLHLFGLPAGSDMDGKVLINAFRDPTLPEPIPSWDEVAGESGCHDPSRQYDGVEAAESLRQLIDLGYIEPLGDDARANVDSCLRESRYNLARSHLDAGRPDLAAPMFRDLLAEDPEQARFHRHLFACCLHVGDRAAAQAVLDEYDRLAPEFARKAAAELTRRRTEQGEAATAGLEPNRREQYERRELAEKATSFVEDRLMLRTRLMLSEPRGKRKDAARELLEKIAKTASKRRGPALFLAEGFAAIDQPERALEWARRALRDYPEDWRALSLAARLHFAAKRYEDAVESAVDSLALIYFQPSLHLLLGSVLRILGDDTLAEGECRVALAQMPNQPAAHAELARIYRKRKQFGEAGLSQARAKMLREELKQNRARTMEQRRAESEASPALAALPALERWDGAGPEDRARVVTIVTGLPRTGTSMMMQMLAAAGVAPYIDGHRPADCDNPRGYFEHEQAIRLHSDSAWLPQARGKAVKIVAQLLPFLPAGEEYRIVFMRRDLRETVASQRAMLDRLGREGGRIGDEALSRQYTVQLVQAQNWLRRAGRVQVLTVDYAEALRDAGGTAQRLAAFLGAPFDAGAAMASVDASLRRQSSS